MYFPPDRNVLRAHLTLFHHLPPSCEAELVQRIREETRSTPPVALIDGLMSLGYGVAYRVRSEGLEAVRANLAEAFTGLLIPQDQAHWRPHVTIQNKAKPTVAKALMTKLTAEFKPRQLNIAGLALWYYRRGPWDAIAAYRFGGGGKMKTPPPLHTS